MPTANPRITVTLRPELHALLQEIARLTDSSQSALIGDLLGQSMPVFERMVEMLRAAHQLKEQSVQARDEISRGLERAQQRIEAQLGLALDDLTEGARPILVQAEKLARRRGRAGDAGGARAPARTRGAGRSTPMSNRGVGNPTGRAKKAGKGGAE